jgi:hypothetical protein
MGRWRQLVQSWRRRWRKGKPPVLWWRRFMDQSVLSEANIRGCAPLEADRPIPFLPAELAEKQGGWAFVAHCAE